MRSFIDFLESKGNPHPSTQRKVHLSNKIAVRPSGLSWGTNIKKPNNIIPNIVPPKCPTHFSTN
jgi:hypothetical protein